jgi:hypothetical protein
LRVKVASGDLWVQVKVDVGKWRAWMKGAPLRMGFFGEIYRKKGRGGWGRVFFYLFDVDRMCSGSIR